MCIKPEQKKSSQKTTKIIKMYGSEDELETSMTMLILIVLMLKLQPFCFPPACACVQQSTLPAQTIGMLAKSLLPCVHFCWDNCNAVWWGFLWCVHFLRTMIWCQMMCTSTFGMHLDLSEQLQTMQNQLSIWSKKHCSHEKSTAKSFAQGKQFTTRTITTTCKCGHWW